MNPPIKDWQGRTVWLVGASSGIGRALASALHARGARVVLSARQGAALQDFVAQHPGSLAMPLDASDPAQVRLAAQTLLQSGPIDLVCYLAGYYQPMRAADFDLEQALRHQEVNLSGVWYVLDALLPALLARRAGHISVVSSVAGFRGLPKSLAYGPTKAALINLAETLYLDLHPQGLGVSLINPGFVATPMTAQNDFTMPALITPEQAAAAILQGWAAGDFHIHFPKRFTRFMQLLRLLPYRWYFALVRRGTGL
ncbi:MAG: SDR family NAD(P)-dependent oxidoreductase [Serpentinimonas sp.]|nr:MAG: short-chain dehydrogenase [Comamonadaceae bacterium BICA1-1]MDO9612237.1 SDR family NAD(P)-dependent oxidoreductase [Serpentinimonas sp.]